MPIFEEKLKTSTWWGQAWTATLEEFDDGRVKRGKKYAEQGRVSHIELRSNKINARVRGQQRPFYYVKLELKAFNASQEKQIQDIIVSSPSISSELERGILSSSLLDLCQEEGLELLPQSWSDFKARCDCADWGDPCKHQAALAYMIAHEIDKDPFVLLSLRGIDIEELRTSSSSQTEILSLQQLKSSLIKNETKAKQNLDYEKVLEDIFANRTKRFSLVELLDEQTPFQAGFKNKLQKNIEEAINKIENFNYRVAEKNKNEKLKHEEVTLAINEEASNFSDLLNFKIQDNFLSQEKLLKCFLSHPLNAELEYMHPSFRFHVVLAHFAMKLILAGLFVPELVENDNNSFFIRYCAKLSTQRNKKQWKLIQENFGYGDFNASEALNHWLHQLLTMHLKASSSKLSKVFAGKESYFIEEFHEQNFAKTINNWLERLSLGEEDFTVLLKFEMRAEDFCLTLNVKDQQIKDYSSWLDSTSEENRKKLNRQLSVISDYIPEIKKIIDSAGKDPVAINLQALSKVLIKVKPILDFLGVEFIFPKELAQLAKPQLKLQVSSKEEKLSLFNMNELLEFRYSIAIGDEKISASEFQQLVKEAQGLLRFKDQFVLLDPNEINRILNRLKQPIPEHQSNNEILFSILAGEHDGVDIANDTEFQTLFEFINKEEPVKIPSGLKAELRSYQEKGFKWLYTNVKKKFGACLADDMGLGKTLQVISLVLALKEEQGKSFKPALIVCPTTLISNWEKECAKFAPDLNVAIYHGAKRQQDQSNYDLLLTSYGTMRRDFDKLQNTQWGLLIIDEAQNIKNSENKQSKAIKSIAADSYIAMTGTPVENRLSELWSIMDFSNRGYLGSLKDFSTNFARPIELSRDAAALKKLKTVTAPFLLRRLKTDKSIISDLPNKIISDDYCNLSKEQASMYEAYTKEILSSIENSSDKERRGLIFKLITTLKQICNHPANFSKEKTFTAKQSGKSLQLLELCGNILSVNEKALIFTQYREMGDILVKLLGEELNEEVDFFHGGLSRDSREEMVENFQKQTKNRLMIISLKAGGTGLNLTAANHVIHYDLWWNPAVENQATDRAFRIGQKKNVQVHRFISSGTFEEKINKIIKEKQELAELTIGSGEAWVNKLSDAELRDLFMMRK